MSRDINRFNGKYLKCVVTPNITSTDVLKNSGSLIVYHPSLKYNVQKYYDNILQLFGDGGEKDQSILTSLNNILVNVKDKTVNEEFIENFEANSLNKVLYDTSVFNTLINQFDQNNKTNNNQDILSFTISPWNNSYKDINDQIYSLDRLGSLEDRPTENNINYLFLGNEFIASGYGFRTVAERDSMTWLSENYNSIFYSLYKLDYINYSLITDMYNKVWPLFNKYIKINGGDVSKTIVHIDNEDHILATAGQDIDLIDILMPGKEADYVDAKIDNKNISITANGITYNMNNNNIVYMPIGSNLEKLTYQISGRTNNSGGIKSAEMSYNYMKGNNNNIYTDGKITNNYSNISDINIDTFNIEYEFNYNYNINEYQQYFVVEGEQTIINYIKLNVKATPIAKAQYYPMLEKKGILLASFGNMIQEHSITLDPVKIVGVYPIFYKTGKITGYDNINNYITQKNSTSNSWNISKSDLDKEMILNNCIEIKINKDDNYLFVAIPIKFAPYKVEFEDGINHFIHNWTGCFKKYNTRQDTGSIETDYENIFCIDSHVSDIRYLKCNLYTLVIGKGVSISGTIRIYVNDTFNGERQEIIFTNTSTGNVISQKNNYTFNEETASYIQNNEFNSIYWLTTDYNRNNVDYYLYYYLSNFNYNGSN